MKMTCSQASRVVALSLLWFPRLALFVCSFFAPLVRRKYGPLAIVVLASFACAVPDGRQAQLPTAMSQREYNGKSLRHTACEDKA